MKLNLKTFKKISTDEHTTVLRNDAGHTITVAHAALHPATRGQLAALPMAEKSKMTGGGEVKSSRATKQELVDATKRPEAAMMLMSEPERKPVQSEEPKKPVKMAEGGEAVNTAVPVIPESLAGINAPQLQDVMPQQAQDTPYTDVSSGIPGMGGLQPDKAEPAQDNRIQYAPEGAPQTMQAKLPPPPAPPKPMLGPETAPPDPYGVNAYQQSYMHGLESQQQGLKASADAAAAVGQAQAKLLGQQTAIQAQQATDYQTHFKALDAERQALLADIQNKHIDPNHFINTQDGASKIATAIGLIASGMGAGMSHQSNLAVDFLHKQIDNDIQAQKAELGKKENLLSANMRQFGNLRDATDMTRVMQSDILSNQLKAEAAKQAGPMARANLLMAAGQLEQQAAPVVAQIAMRKTLLSGVDKGQVSPEQYIMGVVPEHERPAAYKELKEAQEGYQARDNVIAAFDKVNGLTSLGQRVASPFQNQRQIDAEWDPVIAELSKKTAGKFTEADVHMLNKLKPSIGDSEETRTLKRAQVAKLVSEKLKYPLLQGLRIDAGRNSRYDEIGKPRWSDGPARR